jgi:adenine-specific DNA-methyltransferase
MQERLVVARDLLTDDGVIFVSIDDHEQANLKALCDEIFGESNLYAMLVIESGEVFGTKAAHADKTFVKVKDYVLAYAKDKASSTLPKQPLYDETRDLYDSHYSSYIVKNGDDIEKTNLVDHLQSMPWIVDAFAEMAIPLKITNLDKAMLQDEKIKEYIFKIASSIYADQPLSKKVDSEKVAHHPAGHPFEFENKIVFKTASGSLRMYIPFSDTLRDSDEYKSSYTRTSIRGDLWKGFHVDMRNVQDEGDIDYKNGKKPVRLIKNLIKWMNDKDMIVLDFFAGSATTAHATIQANADDGGRRKFMQVQLTELTYRVENGKEVPLKESAEAYAAGFKTIPELSRERIRRAAKKIREDCAKQIASRDTPLDAGFRTYKLTSSNFTDTRLHPSKTSQTALLDTADTIKSDRDSESILTEVILSLGLTLDMPIEQKEIAGHTVYFVGGNLLVACFANTVDVDIVDEIAKQKPLRVVLRDSSFANDETRINIDVHMKQLSPDTEIRVV